MISSRFDILSSVLDSLRICGSLLLHESYSPPWAISIPDAEQLGALLEINAGVKVVAFHLVEWGHIEITLKGTPPAVVEAGEMVICFSGNPHQISQGSQPQSLSVAKLLTGGKNPFGRESSARGTSLLCGVFCLHDTHLNPLFGALPPLLRASVSQTDPFHNLSGVAELIAQEVKCPNPGSHYMVERLLELLCAEAVRSYLMMLQPRETGWLTGLRDPVVSRALSMIHAQPSDKWSVRTLAHGVALSPSRFAARFKATLGESPMGYVSKWRIHLASRLLDSTEKTISEIASDVGYENLAAFNRAFKRHLSVPPGAWRSRHRALRDQH